MNLLINFIFLIILNLSCFSQNNEKQNLNLFFYDECSESFIKPEFKIDSLPEPNYKIITVYINRGKFVGQHTTTIETPNDTIRIPKLLFAFGSELHSKRWNAMNCDNVCDGIEMDFHPNGNKNSEGVFKNGKPIEIKTYRQNGQIISHAFYDNLTLNFSKVSFFDDNGSLLRYQLFENKKKKTVIKTFDKNGTLIATKVEKN